MPNPRPLIAALALAATAVSAAATEFNDPTWPCQQRKVEQLSVGLMWPQPIDDKAQISDALRKEIDDLGETLALRRVKLEDVKPKVEAFAKTHNGDPQLLGMVFERVFNTLSTRRGRIMKGISTFSLRQIALSKKIDKNRGEMDAIMAKDKKDNADFDRVDQLEKTVDWDQEIFTDRQHSITYLCETPVLIERRLYDIAQMLESVVQKTQ